MSEKRLDLAELEKICTELDIADSWFDALPWSDTTTLHIGGGVNGQDIGMIDYITTDHAHKLLKLFKALPKLIEMAGMARSLGVDD